MKIAYLPMLVCFLSGCTTVSEYGMSDSVKNSYSKIYLTVDKKPITIDEFSRASRQVKISEVEHADAINSLRVSREIAQRQMNQNYVGSNSVSSQTRIAQGAVGAAIGGTIVNTVVSSFNEESFKWKLMAESKFKEQGVEKFGDILFPIFKSPSWAALEQDTVVTPDMSYVKNERNILELNMVWAYSYSNIDKLAICYNFLLYGYPLVDINEQKFYGSTYKICAVNSENDIPNRDASSWDEPEKKWIVKSANITKNILEYLVHYELSRSDADSYLKGVDLSGFAKIERFLSQQTGMYFVEFEI